MFRNDSKKAGQSYQLAGKAVKDGWSLVIFPEGGIPDRQCPKMMAFKHGAFKLAKTLNIPIVPLTFTNNYKLFSDPTEILGPARPGIARLYVHPFISEERIQNLDTKELSNLCFEIINDPIMQEYPHLKKDFS